MVFHRDDIYTTSGSTKLLHCFTDPVTKFDTSSFYNWEMDNLPIHDLEERTYLNWEKHGYPSSSVTGFALTVSADAPAAQVKCNDNLFTTVSAAIDALPEVINFPMIIEVANFGQLGQIKLHNFKFGYNGSLEIINRNFAESEPTLATLLLSVGIYDETAPFASYGLLSGVSGSIEPVLAGFGVTPIESLTESSAIDVSTPVFSSTTDTRVGGNFYAMVSLGDSTAQNRTTFALGPDNATSPYNADPDIIDFQAYEYNPQNYDDIHTKDASSTDSITGEENIHKVIWTDANVNGLFYLNRAEQISIKNCDGPIYLRNFIVDASGPNGTLGPGFDIDSSRVFLENCVAVRCKDDGFRIKNSEITILRGLGAYRCYGFQNPSSRRVSDWHDKENISHATVASGVIEDTVAGFHAIDSDIFVSSTKEWEANLQKFSSLAPLYGANTIFNFCRNSIGILLERSYFHGGFNEDWIGGAGSDIVKTVIKSELNTEIGIWAKNSTLSWDGKVAVYGNNIGLLAETSNLELDEFSARHNQREGLLARNSNILYNKGLTKIDNETLSDWTDFECSANGQHIVLESSYLQPVWASGMDNLYGPMTFERSFGIQQNLAGVNYPLPAIELKGGSVAHLVHAYAVRDDSRTIASLPEFGSLVKVTDGSVAEFYGSQIYATRLWGPSTYALQRYKAGVAALNGSRVGFHGPTVIGRYAVDVLAIDKSKMEFSPPKRDGILDVSSWNLVDADNHTCVELHSTRSCLVADDSTIVLEDLGHYGATWPKFSNGQTAISKANDFTVTPSGYTASGSLQFYPNPNDADDYTNNVGQAGFGNAQGSLFALTRWNSAADAFGTTSGYKYYLTNLLGAGGDSVTDFSGITAGGVCLRALNGSKVKARNVHFPCTWWNPSGIIYDTSGFEFPTAPLCNRTFIWNIGSNSELDSSYLSVSSAYPSDAGYHGPSGVWNNNGIAASEAPAMTPDTGTISILDYFGAYSENPWRRSSSWENQGPFRLYFNVDPVTNHLIDPDTEVYGVSPQVFAQGYQLSAAVSAATAVSSLYVEHMQNSAAPVGSGFYFASAMTDPGGKVNVLLDESAANTFANAKHCATGKSGLSKKVSIYGADTGQAGESMTNASKGAGRGFKSTNVFDLERDN
jgi:hypothetical protein